MYAARACASGDNNGCCSLLQLTGAKAARATPEASLYREVRGHDIAYACVPEGRALRTGHNINADPVSARRLFEEACRAQEPTACLELGRMIGRGEGGARDDKRATALIDGACRDHLQAACVDKGHRLTHATPANVSAAVELFEKACQAGEPRGCGELASLLMGRRTAVDTARATSLFQNACNHGSTAGCGALGIIYQEGLGVPADAARAEGLFERSCANRDTESCVRLAASWLLRDPRRAVESVKMFTAACAEDDGQGCYFLGLTYAKGVGVSADLAKAAGLMQKACNLQFGAACEAIRPNRPAAP
jgi:TPR repeat protein